MRITITRVIDAPRARVFETVADIRIFSRALPHVESYEFLTEQTVGVGTRFRETRLMRGKPQVTELEVTEYELDDHVRIENETHGTIWDTVFRVSDESGKTLLSLDMEARTRKWIPWLVNVLIQGMVKKAVHRDLDLVKTFCER